VATAARTRSLLHSLLSPAIAEHMCPPLPSQSCTCSPELAVPATTAHRQRLHLSPSTVFSSRSPCSPWLAVVMPVSSVIARQRSGMLTREEPLCGHLPSASPPTLFSSARAPHRVPDALERLHSPCRGRGCLTGDDPHRRSAMHCSARLPELFGLHRGHRWVRARVGITPVILASPETSPAVRSRRSASFLLGLADEWGPLDLRTHLSISLC
jgi:hypothetical protein